MTAEPECPSAGPGRVAWRRGPFGEGAAGPPPGATARNGAPVRSPHRLVPGRGRTRGPRLPRLAPGPPRGRAVPGRRSPRCSGPCTRRRRSRPRRPGAGAARSAERPGARAAPAVPRLPASTSARNAAIRSSDGLADRQQPMAQLRPRLEASQRQHRHRGLEEVDPRERVRRPRAQQRRHRDPGPVGGPGPRRLRGARAVERIGEADERRVACARAPAPGGPPRPPTATRRARRTSARRRPRPARPAPAPRTRRSRPPPSCAAGSARAPRTRGRAGRRPRGPSWRRCRPRRDRGRSATCPPRYRADVACWYPGPGAT